MTNGKWQMANDKWQMANDKAARQMELPMHDAACPAL
jgi:hypothetical protein